jgi:hypothetical protein
MGGMAAITAGTVSLGAGLIGGAMIAGGALTAIGAITGSKKAQKWGGILSLAGGVAGLATGAWSAASSTLAEQTATESFRAAELAAQAGEGMQGMTGATGLGSLPDSVNTATKAFGDVAPTTNLGGMGQPAADALPVAAQQSTTQTLATAAKPAAATQGGGMLQSVGDTLKSGVDWATKNQTNARITQAGAGLLQAGLGAYGQQEATKEQIKQQEEAQARARQRLNDSIKGVRVPVYQPKG